MSLVLRNIPIRVPNFPPRIRAGFWKQIGESHGDGVAHMSNRQLARVRNREIGFLFQGFNLLSRTSALENVELPLLYARGVSGRERRERAAAALAAVGFGDRLGHHPNQPSGGQQQRVAIARAFVKSTLLLADEPTGNLDSRTSLEVVEIFQRLNTRQGLTIMSVTHERDIAQYARRLVSFLDGRVRAEEPIVSQRSASVDLAALAADDQMRLLSASRTMSFFNHQGSSRFAKVNQNEPWL